MKLKSPTETFDEARVIMHVVIEDGAPGWRGGNNIWSRSSVRFAFDGDGHAAPGRC